MRHVITLLLTFSIAALCTRTMPVEAQESSPNDGARELHELFRTEWDHRMQESPIEASQLGDRRWNDRWPDMTIERARRRQEHYVQTLARLARINRANLSPQDQLNYDLFKREYEEMVEAFKYRLYLLPLTQREGIQTAYDLATALRFETVKDYEDWTARLRALPAYMDQTIELMREGIRERIMWPKVVMQRVPAQVDKLLVKEAQESLFYKPFQSFPDTIPAAERERLSKEARDAITSSVVPAYQKFKDFFVKDYLPASYDEVGASRLPQGKEMYAFLARRNTTTKLTPEEIHSMGLSEVKRIRAEMQTVMDRVGFKGTLSEFFKHLRTDKRFYYQTPEELYEAYQAMSKTIDPKLVKVFKTLPRMPYGVDPIPAAIAPDTTTAYYRQPAADGSRAGTYFVNLYKPESRPKYEMMALSLHEAVPGHHLQIALAFELGDTPNFRRYGGYTAFVEGWGLYAESLGDDMGLYDDPYTKFGQLTYEMWRAVRLVVDTGMHNMNWERQRAIDFFMDNAAKSEQDIVNEIDRYISDPGQALAYKIGQLKIKELRERASRQLATRFDLREFHDVVLLSGAVPLDVLERNVNEWIEKKKR